MKKTEVSLEEKVNYLYEKSIREDKINMIKNSIYWWFRLIIVSFVLYIYIWVNWKIDQTQRYISNLLSPENIKEQMIEAIDQSKNTVIDKTWKLWNESKSKVKWLFWK